MSAKYALIDAEKAFYPTARMCVWLSVSRSGFYEWAGRAPGIREQRRRALTGLVEAIFAHSRGTYGARRIAVVLARSGYPASVALVGRLMAEVGLVACQPRPDQRTTQAGEDPAPVPDLVRRGLHRARTGDQARRGHHVSADVDRLVLSGDGDRLLHPPGRGLVDGDPDADRADQRRDRDGRHERHPYRGGDIPFGPRKSIYQRRVCPHARSARNTRVDGPYRYLLGQYARRIVLRCPEK